MLSIKLPNVSAGIQKNLEEENTLILPTRPNSSSIGAIAFGNKWSQSNSNCCAHQGLKTFWRWRRISIRSQEVSKDDFELPGHFNFANMKCHVAELVSTYWPNIGNLFLPHVMSKIYCLACVLKKQVKPKFCSSIPKERPIVHVTKNEATDLITYLNYLSTSNYDICQL